MSIANAKFRKSLHCWRTSPRCPGVPLLVIEEVWFAADSPLEREGFELAVPPRKERLMGALAAYHRRFARGSGAFAPIQGRWQQLTRIFP